VLAKDSLAHLVLVGDFNDSPKRKNTSLDTLKNAPHLVFLTRDNTSCSYEALPAIDHIVCSPQALKRVQRGSLYTLNLHAMLKRQDVKRISDHCPVVCRFDLTE
jgi:exonuclease III